MSNAHFSKFPQINLPRSRLKIDFNHKLSMMHGYLTPLECFPVVPGDTWDAKKVAHLIHMSTPIVPFMDNIDYYCRIFFVPLRLLWRGSSSDDNSFEKFMGANKGAGYQTNIPVFPCDQVANVPSSYTLNASNLRLNLSHLLGKPVQTFSVGSTIRVLPISLSVLKERGYYYIWNEYFRAEQLQDSYPVDFGDGTFDDSGRHIAKVLLTDVVTIATGKTVWSHELAKVNKKHDYFTSCTISPQYGPSTTIGFNEDLPVLTEVMAADIQDDYSFNNGFLGDGSALEGGSVGLIPNRNSTSSDPETFGPLYVPTSRLAMTSINTLRFGFAVQRYLERSNYGSNHFYEILAVHYGVTSPDARLQRPEYLGGFHFRINVDQVLNATGKTDTDQTQLGQKGAVSVTADRHFGFTKGFVEPGYIYVLAYTKQDRSYSDIVLKEDIKSDRFEFYSPEFANIGDQPVYRFELDAKHTNDDILGFQEAWSEYRYRPARVSADLNPSVTGSMPYWTLADCYNTVPQLGPTWIQEDRTNVARALATGINGPDFLVDFYMECVATRLMPLYSIPGLIDHIGSM